MGEQTDILIVYWGYTMLYMLYVGYMAKKMITID